MLLAIACMLLPTVAGEWNDTDVIEVTLPAGVGVNDQNVAEIIDELISGDPASRSETASVPTPSPSLPEVSKQTTKFRQEFRLGSRELDKDESILFARLYERYTADFSTIPALEVESKITTTCEVRNQYFRYEEPGDRRRLGDNAVGSITENPQLRRRLQDDQMVLMVDFTMTYESRHVDVTEYPILFQNWITNNADAVLTQLHGLGMLRVVEVGSLKRIVTFTPAPTLAPSPFWISAEEPYAEEPYAVNDTIVTIPPPVRTETTTSSAVSRGAISLTAILGFVALILLVGICVFIVIMSRSCRRRAVASRTNADAAGTDAATKTIQMLRMQPAANSNFDAATMATVATSASSYPADTLSSPPPMITDFSQPPPPAFP